MKKIKYKESELEIKTLGSELSVSEFEILGKILVNKYDTKIDRYLDIINIFTSLPKEEVELFEINQFNELVSLIDINHFIDNTEEVNEIIINDVTYRTKFKSHEYKFNVKEFKLITQAINNKTYLPTLAAIVFREVDSNGQLSNDISNEAIYKRLVALKDTSITVIAPYIIKLSKYFLNANSK